MGAVGIDQENLRLVKSCVNNELAHKSDKDPPNNIVLAGYHTPGTPEPTHLRVCIQPRAPTLLAALL